MPKRIVSLLTSNFIRLHFFSFEALVNSSSSVSYRHIQSREDPFFFAKEGNFNHSLFCNRKVFSLSVSKDEGYYEG